MSTELKFPASGDESFTSSEDSSSTQVPDDISDDLASEDRQHESDDDDDTEDTTPKERKVIVMGRKGPLNYRYLDDDGCLDREDPWPVRKTTRHPGPLVRVICGSMNLAKITDVVEEISLPKPACMNSKHGHDHIVSL